MAGLNSGLAPSVVKTAIDMVFRSEYEYDKASSKGLATALSPSIFKQDSIDRSAVITEQFSGPGYWDTRAEQQDVSSGTIRIGNQKTFSVVEFAKSIDISHTFMKDDQHSDVEKAVRDMARLARLTRDKSALEKYRDGFSSVLTNDGAALFSNTHTTLNGVTVDNLATGTLTETLLPTMFVQLEEQKTQDGTLGVFLPDWLLVPTALWKIAVEITKSEFRSGTADNDLNYFSQIYPGLKVFWSPFLGTANAGSNTAFVIGSDNHSMKRWEREAMTTDMVDYKIQRNNNYIYKGFFREVVGPVSYEGLVGSSG